MRRRRQTTSQYHPQGAAASGGGPSVSFSFSKRGTSSRREAATQKQLYRPASPAMQDDDDNNNSSANAGHKRALYGGNRLGMKPSKSSGGAYLAGPMTFPPKDATSDEILRWFLGDQGENTTSNDAQKGDTKESDESNASDNKIHEVDENEMMKRLEAHRRARNRYLASQIETGGAMIDVDGRLVPVSADAGDDEQQADVDNDGDQEEVVDGNNGNSLNADEDNNAGPRRRFGRNRDGLSAAGRHRFAVGREGQQEARRTMPDLNDENVEFIPLPAAVDANGAQRANNNRGRRRWLGGGEGGRQQQEQEPGAAIGQLPNVEPPGVPQPPPSLTFRRICFAVLAVVTAFVCIMLQTLPLFEGARSINPILDPVLKEILVLRDMTDHLLSCGDLRRDRQVFGLPDLLSGRVNDKKSSGGIMQVGDGSDHSSEAATFLGRRIISTSYRFPTMREAQTSIVAASAYLFGLLRHWALYLFTSSSDRWLDCQEGVLHIPSLSILKESYEESLVRDQAWKYPSEWSEFQEMTDEEKVEAKKLKEIYAPYKDGVDLAWSLPCVGGDKAQTRAESHIPASCPSTLNPDGNNPRGSAIMKKIRGVFSPSGNSTGDSTCDIRPMTESRCFRGIHDGIISIDEVFSALRFASDLIVNGGDHVQIRRDVHALKRSLPTVLVKVEKQFREKYGVTCSLEPVAFRVFAALPMQGESLSTPFAGSIHSKYMEPKQRAHLVSAVNRTVYHEWEAENRERNDQPPFHLLRQLRSLSSRRRPFRDPCVLMSDRQRSSDFSYHSSIFLSEGAGMDHTGGTELYVDAHRRNKNPRRRIRRGILIDPSRGRMVLSSGGDENKRCKMPMRTGIRATLQIWWNCR